MNVVTLLSDQAATQGEAPAIVQGVGSRSRSISFKGLEQAVAQRAAMLREAGLAPGERVVLLGSMSIELYVALLAVFHAGLVAVVPDGSSGLGRLNACVKLVEPEAVISSGKAQLLRWLCPAIGRIERRFPLAAFNPPASASAHAHQPASTPVPHARDDEAEALVSFTSGSTARPKAVVRSHGLLGAQHRALSRAMELAPGQRDLCALPNFTLSNLGSGVTTVIPEADLRRPGRIRAAPILRQIAEHQSDRAVASPAFFERLATHCERTDRTLPGLGALHTGGAPVFPRLLERLSRVCPRARLVALYGSTEAEPIAHVGWHELTAEDRAAMARGCGLVAGRPVPEVDCRIIADRAGEPIGPFSAAAFESHTLETGRVGEIVVSGEHVVKGYLHGDGEAMTKFRVDNATWHRTGDAGFFDEAGRLWLLGRATARIDDERGRVYPFAIEAAAMEQPAIERAALIGHAGQRVLVVQPPPGRRDWREQVRALPMIEQVDRLLPMKQLPMDRRHNAKVDYPRLRRQVSRLLR